MIAMTTARGQVRVSWHSVVVPPEYLVLENGNAGVFTSGNNMIGGKMPGVTVLCLSGSWVMIDVTGTKGFFQAVLE